MTIETTRKKLLYRAMHRGTKELDLIIGGFAQARLGGLNETQLREFESILELPETDLATWLTAQADVPPDLNSPLMGELLSFRPALLQ
jgi:antitoxin CptB